ncbi:MAG: hypothetical protein ACRDPT_09995 [Streptomycetales bacterium]
MHTEAGRMMLTIERDRRATVRICIQDPVAGSTYLLDENDLPVFAVDPDDYDIGVDVLFVLPSDDLVQELPASRLTDSPQPSVQIVDPNGNRSWVIPFEKLEAFTVPMPPTEGEVAWFAMPTARELIAAVPVFRKALVQHSS